MLSQVSSARPGAPIFVVDLLPVALETWATRLGVCQGRGQQDGSEDKDSIAVHDFSVETGSTATWISKLLTTSSWRDYKSPHVQENWVSLGIGAPPILVGLSAPVIFLFAV